MIYRNHWRMWAQWQPDLQGHQFAMIREDGDGKAVVVNMGLETIPRTHLMPTSEQVIPADQVESFLQAAMDCGWELGLRPKGAKDMTNELTAVRYHLEDMRTLAKVVR